MPITYNKKQHKSIAADFLPRRAYISIGSFGNSIEEIEYAHIVFIDPIPSIDLLAASFARRGGDLLRYAIFVRGFFLAAFLGGEKCRKGISSCRR
jgi:hypothetical protein